MAIDAAVRESLYTSARDLVGACEAELAITQDPLRTARLHYEMALSFESSFDDAERALQHYLEALHHAPEHLAAIQRSGLRIDSIKGDFSIQPAQAAENPSRVGQVDVVLVGVKAWQVPEAAEQMRPLVGPDTCVIPLQNGVDAPQQLAKARLEALELVLAELAGAGGDRLAGEQLDVLAHDVAHRDLEVEIGYAAADGGAGPQSHYQ